LARLREAASLRLRSAFGAVERSSCAAVQKVLKVQKRLEAQLFSTREALLNCAAGASQLRRRRLSTREALLNFLNCAAGASQLRRRRLSTAPQAPLNCAAGASQPLFYEV